MADAVSNPSLAALITIGVIVGGNLVTVNTKDTTLPAVVVLNVISAPEDGRDGVVVILRPVVSVELCNIAEPVTVPGAVIIPA